MIRILHVVSGLECGNGVMNIIMNYYRNIDKKKIQFDFLYWLDDERSKTYTNEIKELGGNIYYIRKPRLNKNSYSEIKNFFKRYASNYKALHLHEVYLNMIIAPMARKYGIKHIIAHSHTTKYSDIKLNAIRNRMLCLPLKYNTDIYLACSKAAGEFLYGKKYVQSGKVKVIKNAIDCEKFRYKEEVRREKRKEFNVEDKFVVGHIGRFNEQKNHEFLVDIFFEIYNKNKKSVLMLVGDGPLIEKIKSKVNKLKITDHVLFLGQRTNVEELLQVMDTFILPSLFEGLGIVLIEAQSTGLSCIASDVVPIDVKVTNQVSFINLKQTADLWAEFALMNFKKSKRYDCSKDVHKAGYDIKLQTGQLEDLYLNLTY